MVVAVAVVTVDTEVAIPEDIVAAVASTLAMAVVMVEEAAVAGALAITDPEVCVLIDESQHFNCLFVL